MTFPSKELESECMLKELPFFVYVMECCTHECQFVWRRPTVCGNVEQRILWQASLKLTLNFCCIIVYISPKCGSTGNMNSRLEHI